jgi:hypothetical protein
VSLVLCVCFVDRCLSFCFFTFVHCVVCPSSIYGFWLPLWYLQTLLIVYGDYRFTCFCYFFHYFLTKYQRLIKCWSLLQVTLISHGRDSGTYLEAPKMNVVVNLRKSYFHFWFNTNSGGYFPRQVFFSISNQKVSKYVLKIMLKSVGFCKRSVYCNTYYRIYFYLTLFGIHFVFYVLLYDKVPGWNYVIDYYTYEKVVVFFFSVEYIEAELVS